MTDVTLLFATGVVIGAMSNIQLLLVMLWMRRQP